MSKKSNKTEHVLKLITKNQEPEDAAETPEEEFEELGAETVPQPPEPIPRFEPEPVFEPEPTPVGEAIRIPRHKAHPPILRDEKAVNVTNLAEILTAELMGDVMKKLNVCDCDLCRADVMSLTLNILPQKYLSTDRGKLDTQLEIYRKQYEKEALAALMRACVRVKGSPRHKI